MGHRHPQLTGLLPEMPYANGSPRLLSAAHARTAARKTRTTNCWSMKSPARSACHRRDSRQIHTILLNPGHPEKGRGSGGWTEG